MELQTYKDFSLKADNASLCEEWFSALKEENEEDPTHRFMRQKQRLRR